MTEVLQGHVDKPGQIVEVIGQAPTHFDHLRAAKHLGL
jgi:hypothetical protein